MERHRNISAIRTGLLPFDEVTDEVSPQTIYGHPASQDLRRRGLPDLLRDFQKYRDPFEFHKKKNLRLYNLSKLGDPSFEYPSRPLYRLFREIKELDDRYSVIKPQSTFIILWNLFIVVATFFNLLTIPVAFFLPEDIYQFQFSNSVLLALTLIMLIGLVVDNLVVRFNLGFYKMGELIESRVQIFRKYFGFMFWVDLVSWLVIFVYLAAQQPKLIYIKLVFFLKLISFSKINQQIVHWCSIHTVRLALYQLARIVIMMWLFITWVSSIYFYIDYYFYLEDGFYRKTYQLWLTNSNTVYGMNLIESFPWYIWYEYAVYWSLQTSATVGYGDMTPRNPHQVAYCNFIIVLNTVLFAYYMQTIWKIIGGLQESSLRYRENWKNLRSLLKNDRIPAKVNKKVGEYLQEIWIKEDQTLQEEELISMLSEDLKSQLYLSVRGQFFRKIPIFSQLLPLFSEQTTAIPANPLAKQLVFLLEEENIGQGETIYTKGDSNRFVYYILKGKIQISIPALEIRRGICVRQSFGFQEFLTQQDRFITAESLTFCKFWKIEQPVFINTLKKYPVCYQKYLQMKQRILFQWEIELSGVKCIKCDDYRHFVRDCDRINEWRRQLKKPNFYLLKAVDMTGEVGRKKIQRSSYPKAQKNLGLFHQNTIDSDRVCNWKAYRVTFNFTNNKR